MPVHPDYKMLSDDDINMQLAEGIYNPNDTTLFNDEEWLANKNIEPAQTMPSNKNEQVINYLSQKYPEAKQLAQKLNPQKVTNYEFGDLNVTGQVSPEPKTPYYAGLEEWGGNEPAPVQALAPQAEPKVEDRLQGTTLGKMAMSAKDPRLLMAHLAQFAAEFGNLRGKPTQSTAIPFYQAQIALEQQNQDNQFKQQQLDAQKQKTEDPTLSMLRRTQIDLNRNKMQTEQELSDPTSPRSKALRQTMREFARQNGMPDFPENEELSGADALKWISGMTYSLGQRGQTERTDLERKFREQESQKNRQLQRELLQTRGEQQKEIKQTVPGKAPGSTKDFSNALPGWQQVEQINAVTPQEIKAFRDRTAKVPRVVQKINELKSMINKYGGYENTFSAEGARMNSLANDIKLDLKGPEFKALGVLAGPDMNILEALVPDTTKMLNQTRGKAINAALTQLAKNLEDDLVSSGRSIGYQKGGGSGESGPKKTSSGKIIFGE